MPDVAALLNGPWETEEDARMWGRARATIDRFIGGGLLAVRTSGKSVRADLALLDDPAEAVWEFRTKVEKPMTRVFGHFFEQDHFIAFLACRRDAIKTENWTTEKEICKRRWRSLMTPYQPLKGVPTDDYISDCFEV